MKNLRHNLKAMSGVAAAIIIIGMLLAVGIAGYAVTGSVFWGIGTQAPVATPQPSSSGGPPSNSFLTSVTYPLLGQVTDEFAGTNPNVASVIIYPSGSDQYKTSTTTNYFGQYNSSSTAYTSGDVINAYYVLGNAKYWQTVTVPQIASGSVYQTSTINVPLKSFTIGTYTTPGLTYIGNTTNAGVSSTYTMSGATTPAFSYKLTNSGAAGTGLMESYDPNILVNGQPMFWGVYLVAVFAGTGSETVNLNNAGFDGHFSVGTTQYGYIHLDPNALTIWKNADGSYKTYGNGQKYQGTETVSFTPDLTGVTVATSYMTLYTYAYTSPAYAMANSGNWGSYKVSLSGTYVTWFIGP